MHFESDLLESIDCARFLTELNSIFCRFLSASDGGRQSSAPQTHIQQTITRKQRRSEWTSESGEMRTGRRDGSDQRHLLCAVSVLAVLQADAIAFRKGRRELHRQHRLRRGNCCERRRLRVRSAELWRRLL